MLTPKQERFAQEYVVDLNATQAAIRAGYSEGTAKQQGSRLLTNADILARVRELKGERSEETKVTAAYVLDTLYSCAERCMQREPVFNMRGEHVTDEEGRHVWRFDSKGVIGALGLLGKHLGLFVDKVDHTSGGQPVRFTFALDNANVDRTGS